MTDRLQAAVRRRRLHLARRPLPRAPRDRATSPTSSRTATSSASPPTRRSSPRRSPTASGYDDQVARARRRRRRRRRGGRSRSPPTTSATPATCCGRSTTPPTASDGRVSHRGRPAPGPRHRRHRRRGPGAVGGGRPAEPVHQDPGHRGGPAGDHATPSAEGISVNVTLIFGLERYREVMDAFLDRPGAGAKTAGLDLSTIHSVASFFVSRVDTEVDKRLDAIGTDEADGAARQGRHRQRPARLRGVRGGLRHRPLARPSRAAGAHAAAAAVGLDRRQGPATTPTPCTSTDLVVADTVNTMPEKTLEAFADHGEVNGDPVPARLRRRAQAVLDDAGRRRHRLRRRDRHPRAGGRREVREVLERAARRPSSSKLEAAEGAAE